MEICFTNEELKITPIINIVIEGLMMKWKGFF